VFQLLNEVAHFTSDKEEDPKIKLSVRLVNEEQDSLSTAI